MRSVGIIAVGSALMAAAVATAVLVRSVPDIRHYRRLRKM